MVHSTLEEWRIPPRLMVHSISRDGTFNHEWRRIPPWVIIHSILIDGTFHLDQWCNLMIKYIYLITFICRMAYIYSHFSGIILVMRWPMMSKFWQVPKIENDKNASNMCVNHCCNKRRLKSTSYFNRGQVMSILLVSFSGSAISEKCCQQQHSWAMAKVYYRFVCNHARCFTSKCCLWVFNGRGGGGEKHPRLLGQEIA